MLISKLENKRKVNNVNTMLLDCPTFKVTHSIDGETNKRYGGALELRNIEDPFHF